MKCPSCGANNKDDAVSCWQCYAGLSAGPSPPPRAIPTAIAPTPAGHAAAPSKKPLPVGLIVAVLLAIGAGSLGWVFYQRSGGTKGFAPDAVVRAYLEGQKNKDFPAMKETLVRLEKARIDTIQKRLREEEGYNYPELLRYEVTKTEVSGEEASVRTRESARVAGREFHDVEQHYILVKEDGDWRIALDRTESENGVNILRSMGVRVIDSRKKQ